MKVRDSGMPQEALWRTYFDPIEIFENLGLDDPEGVVVDFGSGYGTFTIPAAKHFAKSSVVGLDLEEALNSTLLATARSIGIRNLSVHTRDFIARGTGLDTGSVKLVLLFNILHAEQPVSLLQEAHRILVPKGRAAIIHWNYDPTTPRGPLMEIRPKPEQAMGWAREAGFVVPDSVLPVAKYHYGFTATKP